jgi:hypothetical protein
LPWLEREFDWKESTAENLKQIARAFSNSQQGANLPALNIPMYALVALSKPRSRNQAIALIENDQL